jgi:hypothetical protein
MTTPWRWSVKTETCRSDNYFNEWMFLKCILVQKVGFLKYVPTSIQKTSPLLFLNSENTWPDRIRTTQDYLSENIRIFTFIIRLFGILPSMSRNSKFILKSRKNIWYMIGGSKNALLLLVILVLYCIVLYCIERSSDP